MQHWPAHPGFQTIAGLSESHVLDATDDGAAIMFNVGGGRVITHVGWNKTVNTGTPPTYRLALESGTATRVPDGTVLGTTTAKHDTLGATMSIGMNWYALDTPYTVAAGGKDIASTIRYLSGTVDASNCITLGTRSNVPHLQSMNAPYRVLLTAAAWGTGLAGAMGGIKFDDGSVELGTIPAATVNNDVWNSGSSPRRRGNRLTITHAMELYYMMIGIRLPANSDWDLEVYKNGSGSTTFTKSIDGDVSLLGTAVGVIGMSVPATDFAAGDVIDFILNPTTANSNTSMFGYTFPDTACRQAIYGDMYKISGTAGSFTEDTLSGLAIYPVFRDVAVSGGPLVGSDLVY